MYLDKKKMEMLLQEGECEMYFDKTRKNLSFISHSIKANYAQARKLFIDRYNRYVLLLVHLCYFYQFLKFHIESLDISLACLYLYLPIIR